MTSPTYEGHIPDRHGFHRPSYAVNPNSNFLTLEPNTPFLHWDGQTSGRYSAHLPPLLFKLSDLAAPLHTGAISVRDAQEHLVFFATLDTHQSYATSRNPKPGSNWDGIGNPDELKISNFHHRMRDATFVQNFAIRIENARATAMLNYEEFERQVKIEDEINSFLRYFDNASNGLRGVDSNRLDKDKKTIYDAIILKCENDWRSLQLYISFRHDLRGKMDFINECYRDFHSRKDQMTAKLNQNSGCLK